MTKANPDYPFTPEEFHAIYSKVPRLTIELIAKSDKGVLLSLRDIEPCKGWWHIPGGTVFMGEMLAGAVRRVAKRELGVDLRSEPEFIDYIEYPEFYKQGFGHAVGLAYLINFNGELKPNHESAKLEWFREVPPKTIIEQDEFIKRKVL